MITTCRYYPTAEIHMLQPSEFNNWRWAWVIFIPDLPGQPELANGYGLDREDCWQKAIRARQYIQSYGKTF